MVRLLAIIDEINSGAHEEHVYAWGMHLSSNIVEYYHVDHMGRPHFPPPLNLTAPRLVLNRYDPQTYDPASTKPQKRLERITLHA